MCVTHPENSLLGGEYYSESPLVRWGIRQHTERTIAALKAFCDRMASATGIPIDTESVATILANQGLSLFNYYLGLPRSKRAKVRPALIRSLVQLSAGGVLAVRHATEDGAPARQAEGVDED